jgi:hypothetical protein
MHASKQAKSHDQVDVDFKTLEIFLKQTARFCDTFLAVLHLKLVVQL